MTSDANRPLTTSERRLAKWMLEHGTTEAREFLQQLEDAEVTPWKCPCGCASFNFQIRGMPPAPPGVHILGDFVFGTEESLAGVFICSSNGILSGVEVYGLAGDAPNQLPDPEELRPFDATNRTIAE
jgi:hypothetical protein